MKHQPPNAGRRYNPAPDPDIKLSVHVPESLIRAIDRGRGDATRSEWIRLAIRERLDKERSECPVLRTTLAQGKRDTPGACIDVAPAPCTPLNAEIHSQQGRR